MKLDQWLSELSRFADLDATLTHIVTDRSWVARFRQKGVEVEICLDVESGSIVERREGNATKHGTYRGLLASPNFGDLRQLARMQLAVLQRGTDSVADDAQQIHVTGDMEGPGTVGLSGTVVEQVDAWTSRSGVLESEGVKALVVDGPAGIGKTHLIRALTARRAEGFGPNGQPLVLHVQSRGRQLTTLPDLLAGTLQGMRVGLTFDQVPILAHHELLQIAIDGFDELADPNGYETAWHSLRDFISDMRGQGVLILAGRDTFINAASVQRALNILSSKAVASVHLRPTLLAEAKDWLKQSGLDDKDIKKLEEGGLLEDGSYALRPFFLRRVRDFASSSGGIALLIKFPLGALVDAMVAREAPLIRALKLEIPEIELIDLLQRLLSEVAREMADSESDSIDVESLQLISEIVFDAHLAEEQLRALRNRIKSIALLDVDQGTDRRRFVHSEVHAYFLANAYMRLLCSERVEIARSLKRNIFGSDFLEVFHDVSQGMAHAARVLFQRNAEAIFRGRLGDDRTRTNVCALMLASLDGTQPSERPILFEDVALDEAVLRGTIGSGKLARMTISQLDVRGADLTELILEECQVSSLIVDDSTLLPLGFPSPRQLTYDTGSQQRLFDPTSIQGALEKLSICKEPDGSAYAAYIGSESGRLLDKICRAVVRQTWIREGDDYGPALLLRHVLWEKLRVLLIDEEILEERSDFPAGGKRSTFIRVKHAKDLLVMHDVPEWIAKLRLRIVNLHS
jgi:hypothetical protein